MSTLPLLYDRCREMTEHREEALGVGAAAGSERASGDSRILSFLAPLRVARARIVRRPGRLALVALGVALATGSLVAVSASTLLVRERALHASLETVPPSQRSFRVDEFGLAFPARGRAERAARAALAQLSSRPAVEAVEFHPLRFRRHLLELTAVERLGSFVHVESGRLPRRCTARRCEVLEIGTAGLPRTLRAPGLRVVPVGRAALRVPAVLGDFTEPSNATLVVASDVPGLASLPVLASFFRTASWVAPFGPGEIHEWEAARLLAREARVQALLESVDPAFRLSAPDDAVTAGRSQGRIGSRRMLLVGGELAVLLLGFALLAAVGLRRTIHAEWRRLEERGARSRQLWLFLVAETGAAALAGALVGLLLGVGVAVAVGRRAGITAGDVLAHGVLTSTTVLLVGATWLLATLVLVLAARGAEGPRAGPVRLADVLALGVLATAVVAASRGSAGSSTLADDRGSIVLLLLFPALVSLFAALAARRALGPALRLAERGSRRARPSLRLALVSLARAPARTAIAVAFLVVSIGLALLAAGYRATLERGVRDEAAYQVPLDYSVSEGTQPVARVDTDFGSAPLDYAVTQGALPEGPLDAAPLSRYRALAPGVQAFPVLRRYGDVPGTGTEFTSPVLLGLDPEALRTIHGWRSDFGRESPDRLARLLGSGGRVNLAGPILPAGTTGFALSARQTGAEVNISLAVAKPSGEIVHVPLVAAGAAGAATLERVPPRSRVVALELSLTQAAADAIAHSEGEGSIGGVHPVGSLELGPLVAYAGSRRLGIVTAWSGWIGRSGARRLPGRPVQVRYALQQGQVALLRPREPTDGRPLPLVVSPDVARSAAPGGLLTIQNGDQSLTGRIVAVAHRFPGTADGGGTFAVADESHLQTAFDAGAPGTGRPLEVWLSVPHRENGAVASALRRPPFSTLAIASRGGLEQELRASPLSRAIELALAAGALVALGLAVCGIWLTLLGDVTDERGELYDLEAQGMTPAELRGQLRIRVAILAVFGIAGGVVLGLVLSGEVVRLLQVTAAGGIPVPPLVKEQGWGSALLALVAFALVGAALVEATVHTTFRDPAPSRSGEIE